jgi:hypothetical protein
MSKAVFLNDILKLEETLNLKDLSKVKIRFVTNSPKGEGFDPLKEYKKDKKKFCEGLYWNYKKKKFFKVGDITIGFFRINKKDPNKWLLFYIGKVTEDLDKFDGFGYKGEATAEYEEYFGRLVIEYHSKATGAAGLVSMADKVMKKCKVIYYSTPKYSSPI